MNINKIVLALIIIVNSLVFVALGYLNQRPVYQKYAATTPNKTVVKTDRFVTLYTQEHDDSVCHVIQDTVTGKKYFYFQYYQSAGMVEIQ